MCVSQMAFAAGFAAKMKVEQRLLKAATIYLSNVGTVSWKTYGTLGLLTAAK